MEHEAVWSTPDDIDNFLNDIWTNADLEPPNLIGEIMCSGVNDPQQMNHQGANVQSTVGHTSPMEEKIVTAGSNFTIFNKKLSPNQSADDPSHKKFVIEEESVAQGQGSNLCTMVSSQSRDLSAGGPSHEKCVPKEVILTEVSKLCTLVNNQISRQNEAGLHREFYFMEDEIDREVSSLCTLVNNFISSQSEGGLSHEHFFTKEEIVAELSNMLVNNQSSIKCSRGPSHENFVTKEEIVAEGSNLYTLVSNLSTIGPSRRKLVIKGESATEGSSLFSRGNSNQRAKKRSACGPMKRRAGDPTRSVDSAEMQRRRMIKNRASAARSRARSLIRLASLEREVEQYKKENAMLRQKKQRALEHGNAQAQPRDDKTLHCSKSCSW